ncbi:MAG TPA: fused MFS/spermidine synthase [Terriglobales bacterium]|nr:fused MFS/spermidine synthase [Terriglobales bacterium]
MIRYTSLYAVTTFSSAFLLFQIQPIIAKLILPWFGGAAAVWSVCLLFFQAVLVLGYLYAHLLTHRVQQRLQAWVHILLIAVSALLLPISAPSVLKPSGAEDPATRVLMVLAVSIGLPYFLLSATSPLLQAWQSKSHPTMAAYRLYAFSNMGSLLGLLSYPLVIEPRTSNLHQAVGWSVAYGLVGVLCAAIALQNRTLDDISVSSDTAPAPDWKLKGLWTALAACGSMLLLSVTSYISQNIAAVPLLWTVPLGLYLYTFILCFGKHRWYRRGVFLRFLGVALASMGYALAPDRANVPPPVLIPVFCAGLFVCCMVCHGELAQLKPPTAYLTTFYLLISFGGAMGATLVALVAPHTFRGYYELPISLGLCAVLIPLILCRRPRGAADAYLSGRALTLITVLVAGFCVSLYVNTQRQASNARVRVRNFYGALRVEDRTAFAVIAGVSQPEPSVRASADPRYRDLINGSIEHGIQFLAPGRGREPTTYYGPTSGVGLAIRAAGRQGAINVGAIGLGTGTLAAYGRSGDHYTFYEINPQVVAIANREFSFLRQCPAKVSIVVGDARLSLEREAPQSFDVLAVDAFTSDAIPTHLLTREAFSVYLRHMKTAGLIAIHVSNKYLNLAPVVSAAADSLDRRAVLLDSPADSSRGLYVATWLLVGNDQEFLREPELDSLGKAVIASKEDLWTDDHTSIFKALK